MIINNEVTNMIEAMNQKYKQIEGLKQITNKRWNNEAYKTIEEKKEAWNKIKTETEIAANELRICEIEIRVMKDNTRRIIYQSVMPIVIDILKKYNNKPYGAKTKDKICEEMKQKTNCSLYFYSGYHEDISITVLNDKGFTDFRFKYDDFNIYVKYPNKDEKGGVLTSDNRINGSLEYEDFYFSNCGDYRINARKHAENILQSLFNLNEKYRRFESEISIFNNMLPSGIDRRYVSGYKDYI